EEGLGDGLAGLWGDCWGTDGGGVGEYFEVEKYENDGGGGGKIIGGVGWWEREDCENWKWVGECFGESVSWDGDGKYVWECGEV
ncbi:hypothetical protein, partial [Micrococcus luteus]|uniref:hypothetical protein n=1 Tax=Micrococcus luteus TaxID=1270 RepID=UPI001C92C8BB